MDVKVVREPIVKSLGGAGLKVTDLERMVAWYGKLLAMPIKKIDPDIPFYIFDMDNRVNLVLDDYRNQKGLRKFPISQFKTTNIEQAYHLVKKSGVKVVLEMQYPHPGLKYFNFEDTEGNVLQLVESDWVNPEPINPFRKNHPIKNHLNTCIVPVKSLKRATEWYSALLGFPIKPNRLDGGPIYWFEMDHGTALLLDDNRNNQYLERFPTFMLKASDIHQAFAFVKQKKITILQNIQFDHFFIIQDPEGNSIMICM